MGAGKKTVWTKSTKRLSAFYQEECQRIPFKWNQMIQKPDKRPVFKFLSWKPVSSIIMQEELFFGAKWWIKWIMLCINASKSICYTTVVMTYKTTSIKLRERDYIPYEFDKIQMKKLDSHSNNNNSNNKNNSIHLRNPANL